MTAKSTPGERAPLGGLRERSIPGVVADFWRKLLRRWNSRREGRAQLTHELREAGRVERLRAVAESLGRVRMYLHHDARGAHDDGGFAHGDHEVAAPERVARVHDDGQVGHLAQV